MSQFQASEASALAFDIEGEDDADDSDWDPNDEAGAGEDDDMET